MKCIKCTKLYKLMWTMSQWCTAWCSSCFCWGGSCGADGHLLLLRRSNRRRWLKWTEGKGGKKEKKNYGQHREKRPQEESTWRGDKGRSERRHLQYRFDHFYSLTYVNKDICLNRLCHSFVLCLGLSTRTVRSKCLCVCKSLLPYVRFPCQTTMSVWLD